MKITAADRKKIRLWAEKAPDAHTQVNKTEMTLEDGSLISLARVTTQIPNGPWKVRTAYLVDTGRPIYTTGPILRQNTNKKG